MQTIKTAEAVVDYSGIFETEIEPISPAYTKSGVLVSYEDEKGVRVFKDCPEGTTTAMHTHDGVLLTYVLDGRLKHTPYYFAWASDKGLTTNLSNKGSHNRLDARPHYAGLSRQASDNWDYTAIK